MFAFEPDVPTKNWRRNGRSLCFILAAAVFGMTSEIRADSLNEALVAAYASNPVLQAQRAATRAADEGIPQARAGLLPRIFGNANVGYKRERIGIDGPNFNNAFPGLEFPTNGEIDAGTAPHGYSITLQQQIFKGLQTLNSIRGAEANALASRESLRSSEQATLLNAVTAYMDVVQSQAITRLRRKNVTVLTDELASNQRRLKEGQLTETDVAQSEARRATAIALLEAAKAQLQSSRATYEEVIGSAPYSLQEPRSISALLPRSLEAALEIAQFENPNIGQAFFLELAAGNNVDALRGQLLPEVSLQLQYGDQYDTFKGVDFERRATATIGVTVPFYEGGLVSSQVRQAKQVQLQRRSQLQQAQLQTRSAVVSAWSQLNAARAQLSADLTSLSSNKIALDGTRREEVQGHRTVLDVLNAEQSYLTSQVQIVTDKRNLTVAEYTLLQAIGRLTATYLSLPVATYRTDITDHSERVLLWRTEVKPEPEYYRADTEPQ